MKLLVDASFHTGIRVGIARYIECLVQELSLLCNITVLTSVPDIFSGVNCNIITIPRWTRSQRGRLLWQLTQLKNHCTTDYDLLFCTTPVAPPACPIPVISVVHDLTPLIQNRLHNSKYKTSFLIGLKSIKWADYVVTDSVYTKQQIIRKHFYPAEKIKVVYLGPGVYEMYQNCNLGLHLQPYILYVGGHIPTKNVTRLVNAFALLNRQPRLKLVLTGWGNPDQIGTTLTTIDKAGVNERVVILPEISDRELSSLYHHCSLFAFPSLCEGFGLPVLEAMLHGAAIACSYSSSLPEIAGSAAVYFDATSIGGIRQALELLLDNPGLRQKLSQAAQKRARIFSWKKAALEILKLAEQVILNRSQARIKC
ncbi:MAG: glycosyltransferase family 4 protein [candidate division WOR-3 bacterium]|jgi:glycosyltransferase involved in cell wall biosynthesis